MAPRSIAFRRARRRGFTLIEVMVAVGLTAVMLWGLLQLFTSATRFSSAVTNETELAAAGRAALERMVREITAASPPRVAYFKINDGGDFDTIQFVAPVGSGGTEMVHVKYHVTDGQLMRGVDDKGNLESAPVSYPEDASFGVQIEGLNIRHIPATGGNPASGSVNATTETDSLPRAVLIELRLRDERGLAQITLSSAAVLVSDGI